MRQITINDLPDEMLAQIFNNLSISERSQCKLICRRWRWIIENLVFVYSLLLTTDRVRSIGQNLANKLCKIKLHQFKNSTTLIVNPIYENLELIFIDSNHLARIRALKLDLDTAIELKLFKWNRILKLLEQSSLIEHLELRVFTEQETEYLNILNHHLTNYNQFLKHLSFKKIQFMDFFQIRNLDLFESHLFKGLVNLTVFECDFCILNDNDRSVQQRPNSQLVDRKRQFSKLYLPNANLTNGLIDDYSNLNSLGLGIVDEILLNQLLSKYSYLNRLEIKIRQELTSGQFIANYTIKQLIIHSLGIRLNVNRIIEACKTVQVLRLINCLFTNQTVCILIEYNCLQCLDIQNDYSDDDRQVDWFISSCFERCSKLTTGFFKNVNLKNFFKIINSLAKRNATTIYSLYLDDIPTVEAFEQDSNCELPANLVLNQLLKDYNY